MSDDRITKKEPRGTHVTLICANHPYLAWSTKNIGSSSKDGHVFFDRHIFFLGHQLTDHQFEMDASECICSPSLLRLHPQYSTYEDVPE